MSSDITLNVSDADIPMTDLRHPDKSTVYDWLLSINEVDLQRSVPATGADELAQMYYSAGQISANYAVSPPAKVSPEKGSEGDTYYVLDTPTRTVLQFQDPQSGSIITATPIIKFVPAVEGSYLPFTDIMWGSQNGTESFSITPESTALTQPTYLGKPIWEQADTIVKDTPIEVHVETERLGSMLDSGQSVQADREWRDFVTKKFKEVFPDATESVRQLRDTALNSAARSTGSMIPPGLPTDSIMREIWGATSLGFDA